MRKGFVDKDPDVPPSSRACVWLEMLQFREFPPDFVNKTSALLIIGGGRGSSQSLKTYVLDGQRYLALLEDVRRIRLYPSPHPWREHASILRAVLSRIVSLHVRLHQSNKSLAAAATHRQILRAIK